MFMVQAVFFYVTGFRCQNILIYLKVYIMLYTIKLIEHVLTPESVIGNFVLFKEGDLNEKKSSVYFDGYACRMCGESVCVQEKG